MASRRSNVSSADAHRGSSDDGRAVSGRGTSPWLKRPAGAVTSLRRYVLRNRIYRVVQHYLWEDGNLLAAGMSFQSVFAVFAAVFVGFAVTGLWLSGRPELREALIEVINRAVPDLIATDGIIHPDVLANVSVYGFAGLISLIGLGWTTLAWFTYTRQAVRAIFQVERDRTNFVVLRLGDLLLALGFGLLLIISAVLSIISTQALSWIASILGLDTRSAWGQIGAIVTALLSAVVINVITLSVMFRVLSRLPIPWRSLATGVIIGASALAGLTVLGGAVLNGASSNPLLATFAVFIGLLIWFNLNCRVILLSASWIAVGLADNEVELFTPSEAEKAALEQKARKTVALAELRDAAVAHESAKGIARWAAHRRLKRAQGVVDSMHVDGSN